MKEEIIFAATGDSFITRNLPVNDQDSLELSSIIKKAHVRFTNLEVTLHESEGIPSAVSGGTWAKASPIVLKDIKKYGFNLIAWANNHTLDYSFGGLEATERNLNENGFIHGGAGENLASASEPRYLETTAGRVALIAATSTFHESWAAGDQRSDMIGRPGVNPLRFQTIYKVTPEKLLQLKEIASTISINAVQNLRIKEGYGIKRSKEIFTFGAHLFKEDKIEGVTTSPITLDMERITKAINEAKRQSKYTVVSIHAHEMEGDEKDKPAEFLQTFARTCIDNGAHAVIGHGPHILRGIEIYKNRPIFYSLGNFIFQNDTIDHLPSDFYEKYGLSQTDNVADAIDCRSKNNTIGLGVDPLVWQSVLPIWRMKNGELTEIKLYPLELGFEKQRYERGWPVLSENVDIIKRISQLSESYGTKITIEDGIGKILIEETICS